jgi:hypothetical protein
METFSRVSTHSLVMSSAIVRGVVAIVRKIVDGPENTDQVLSIMRANRVGFDCAESAGGLAVK